MDVPASSPEVIVRDYAEGDYGACRYLWAELTEYHRARRHEWLPGASLHSLEFSY